MATKLLTPANLDAAQRGIQTKFTKLYGEAVIGPMELAFERFDSDGPGENYPVVGAVPGLSVFEGTRSFTGIRTDGMYVANVEYDAGLEIPRLEISRDKLGKYNGRIQEMAIKAKTYVARLIGTILQNGTSTTLAKCWDGAALFSAAHGKESGASQSNIATGGGVSTLAQVVADIEEALAIFAAFKDDKGDYLGPIVPNAVFYPAANAGLAGFLRTLQGGRTALDTADYSSFLQYVIPVPEMTGNDYALAAIGGGLRPFGYQVEIEARPETWEDKNAKSVKMSIEHVAAAFCGDWTKIVKVDNS